MPDARRELGGLDPARPHDRAGQDLATVGEHDPIGLISVDLHAELELDAPLLEHLLRVRVRAVGERREHDRRRVDQMDLRPARASRRASGSGSAG